MRAINMITKLKTTKVSVFYVRFLSEALLMRIYTTISFVEKYEEYNQHY